MAQPVFADRVILPPNSTGTPTGWFAAAVAGGTLFLPGTVLVDPSGNAIDSAHPLAVSLAAVPTVTEKQDQTANVATTWTSATSLNTTTATYAATGYGTANVAVRVPTTTTAGAVTIEISQDGTDWVPAGAVRQDNGYAENPVPLAYFPGTNGARVYAFSIDAFTLIRVRLSTGIVGAGNVVVTISAVAGGIEPIVAQRSRKVPSYRAVFRAAATPWILTQTTVANTKHQQLTIHHPAASTKTVRLRHLWYSIVGNTVAGVLHVTLYRLTSGSTPATGNPPVTPSLLTTADAAAEATCLVKPTTAGTEGALVSHHGGNLGVAAPATIPSAFMSPMVDLVQMAANPDDEGKALEIRAGVLEGYGVSIEMSSVTNISFIFIAEFTEEVP